MSKDDTNQTMQERSRIHTDNEYELHYWGQKLGVSKAILREAAHRVGNSIAAVRAHLGK